VLVKKKGGWKIMQYVLSVPVPNEIYKEVLRLIQKHETGIE